MAQETFTAEQFFAECEALGEDKVRIRLVGKIYGDGNHKKALAEEWLRRKETERTDAINERLVDRAEASEAAARSSARAQWVANGIAALALLVAILAMVFGD